MNVGLILNGDSPQEDADQKRPELPVQRHSINNLLNDTPGPQAQALKVLEEAEKSDEDDDDVDSDAERLNRELAAQEEESQDGDQPETPPVENVEKVEKAEKVENQNKLTGPNGARESARESSLIGGELQKLSLLKQGKKKPTRYREPPVWAQQWIPPSLQRGDGPPDRRLAHSAMPDVKAAAEKSVFNTAMHSADLECLITGIIPPPLTVRTIAEWLYANFVEISLENRQYVELELKFGTMVLKTTGARLDIGVLSECVYTKALEFRFEMAVHEVGWADMKTFLGDLEKQYQEEVRKQPSRPRRKFAVTESDTTDFFYHTSERNEVPQKIRISKDNMLTPARYVGITKKRLLDLYIHEPSLMYDLRLSLSLELPVNEASIEPTMKKMKPTLQRGKKRTSYTHAPTVTRFDFTEVLKPKHMRNKAGKTIVEHEKLHELELEIDTFQIFRGFDKVRDGSDTIRFEELVEIFLNNARCLNNRVTKLASK